MLKKELRKQMKIFRDGMSADERFRLSQKIAEKLFTTKEYTDAENILIFVSYGSEIDTLPIIQNAIDTGKNVAVPRIDIEDENKVMNFYRINSLDELVPGFYGIPEPDESHTIPCEPKDALVIVPGLVFDKNMYRIGYGGGFYDKYLSEQGRKNYKKLAVAFDFQVLKEEYIETDANDIPVDMIITEKTEYC